MPEMNYLGPHAILSDLMKDKDTAVFQCNASNIHGYVFSNTYLNVLAESPKFTEVQTRKTRKTQPDGKRHRRTQTGGQGLQSRESRLKNNAVYTFF